MATRVQPRRQHRFALLLPLLARPRAVRLIATLGSVLVTVGLYVPDAGRALLFHGDPVHCHPMARTCDTWVIADAVRAGFAPLSSAALSLPAQLGIEVV